MNAVHRLLATAIAALFAAPLAAQQAEPQVPPVRWQQSPIIFLPDALPDGEGQFLEAQQVVEFPLRWAMSTRLAREVVLQNGEETIRLEAGSLLPAVQIGGTSKAERGNVFCTRSRTAEHREGVGLGGLLFGSMLNSAMDKVHCLEDSELDGSFDRAIALGDGPGIVDLGAIEPLAFTELLAEPLGTQDDVARLTLLRVGRRQIELQFDIIQRGSSRTFSSFQSGRFHASSVNPIRYGEGEPGWGNLLGLRFDVVEAVSRENRANLRWSSSARPGEFIVIPDNVTTTYSWY